MGSPSELINVSKVESQVPRSAKYLCHDDEQGCLTVKRVAYRSVLNTVKTMLTKKLIARSACCDRRTDRYITSMVL